MQNSPGVCFQVFEFTYNRDGTSSANLQGKILAIMTLRATARYFEIVGKYRKLNKLKTKSGVRLLSLLKLEYIRI